MNRRLFSVILLASLLSSVALPAFAKDGEDDDEESGSDDSGDNSGSDDDKDDDKGDDDKGDDDGNGEGGSGGSGRDGGDDHDDAKDALDANKVLPLRQILALLKKRGDFTVIDVKLRRSDGVLFYALKCIDSAGAVRKFVFDAKTGAVVD